MGQRQKKRGDINEPAAIGAVLQLGYCCVDLAELMCRDVWSGNESRGAHFREEYQTPEGEALRNDQDFCYVSAWEWQRQGQPHHLHKEPLVFENVELTVRSYK